MRKRTQRYGNISFTLAKARPLRALPLTFVALALSLAYAAGASAASWRLDGKVVEQATATSQANHTSGGCDAVVTKSPYVNCFTTEAKRDAAVLEALRRNETPPGFTAMPSPEESRLLIKSIEARQLASVSGVNRKPRAKASACGNQTTHVFTGYYKGGTYGVIYYSRYSWDTLNSTFSKTISSDQTSGVFHVWYATQIVGDGYRFTQAQNFCHLDNDLRLDSLGSGTWDNKFVSVHTFS